MQNAVRKLRKIDAYRASLDVHDEGRKYIFRAHPFREPTDPNVLIDQRIDTVAGDFLYNIRAALDYTVYALALNATPRLTDKERGKLQFPIVSRRVEDFDSQLRQGRLKGVGSLAQAQIKRLQPYPRRRETRTKAEIEIAWGLGELARFSNIDKHRRLHVVQWISSLTSIGIPKIGQPKVTRHQPPYGDGAPVVTLVYPRPVTQRQVLMHNKFEWTVGLEGAPMQLPGFLIFVGAVDLRLKQELGHDGEPLFSARAS